MLKEDLVLPEDLFFTILYPITEEEFVALQLISGFPGKK